MGITDPLLFEGTLKPAETLDSPRLLPPLTDEPHHSGAGRVDDCSVDQEARPGNVISLPVIHASDASVSEAILTHLSELCSFSIIVVGAFGEIVRANSQTERMFGYAQDELVGQTVDLLVPSRLRAQHARHRDHFATHPDARLPRNVCGQRKDGTEFPAEVSLSPIDANGETLMLGVVVDISERLRIEGLKDEFVATVSHELRTPLTSIAGALGLLISHVGGTLPASTMRLLTIAHVNSQRLGRLVNSLLDMEKIESGKVVFVLKRLAVRALVVQAIENIHGFAEEYGVRVTLDAASTSDDIRADPDWLMQIVTNLLSNAIKFSPRGEEVVVAIESRDGKVLISVRDHGHGVPEEFKPRIFEKFAQADSSDARQQGGTGLGLNIVKQIVERLSGTVRFDDADGGGAIFQVELPAWPQGAPQPSGSVVILNANPAHSDD